MAKKKGSGLRNIRKVISLKDCVENLYMMLTGWNLVFAHLQNAES